MDCTANRRRDYQYTRFAPSGHCTQYDSLCTVVTTWTTVLAVKSVRVWSRSSTVGMMETAQDRDSVDEPGTNPLVYRRSGSPLAQALMRSLGVKVAHVLPE